jgi:hypothetical protein
LLEILSVDGYGSDLHSSFIWITSFFSTLDILVTHLNFMFCSLVSISLCLPFFGQTRSFRILLVQCGW